MRGSNDQATQLVSTVQDEQTTSQPIDDSSEKVTFREEKVDEIDRARSLLLDPRKEVSQILTTHEHMLPITVGCECGYAGEEGDMVRLLQHSLQRSSLTQIDPLRILRKVPASSLLWVSWKG